MVSLVVLFVCLSGLLIGIAIAAVGVRFTRDHLALSRHGVHTWGTIEDRYIRRPIGRGAGPARTVVFTFAAEGRRVRGEAAVEEQLYHSVPEGTRIAVLYERGNPSNHRLTAEFSEAGGLLYPAVVLLCGGAVLLSCGYAGVLILRGSGKA